MSGHVERPEPPPTPFRLTPCIGICRLDERGYCVGCQRTGEEIGRWRTMSDAERLHVMQRDPAGAQAAVMEALVRRAAAVVGAADAGRAGTTPT